MSFRSSVADAAVQFALDQGRTDIKAVKAHLREAFTKELQQQAEQLLDDWLRGAATDGLRRASVSTDPTQGEDSQLPLPGMPLPLVITKIRNESGEVEYVASQQALIDDMEGHQLVLDSNVRNAVARADDWRLKVDTVRPMMLANPGMVLGEIIKRL